ncbi:MAG: GNAT family N-acetyltransferase [Candidatus Bathyarchaeota archaeon]|nr:GNAT family N-acetyltransferase [Candidatus Bathyarchaeota archaeon]
MTEGYMVRWFEEGDFDRYVSGLNEELYDSYDLRRFEWKFLENPSSLGFVSVVVVEDEATGEPVGFNGFVPFEVACGGGRFLAVQGCDGFVYPDHQRRGLFTRTLEFMEAELLGMGPEVLVSFNFPGSAAAARKAGSVAVCEIDRWSFVLDDLVNDGGASGKDVELHPCTVDDIYPIYRKWAKEATRLHIRRSIDYLRWRFLRNPLRIYDFHRISEGGSVRGYLVCGREEDEGSIVMGVDDYVLLDGNPDTLMEAFVELARKSEPVDRFELLTIQGSGLDRALRGLGLEPEPRFTMILKGIQGVETHGERLFRGDTDVTSAMNWHVTYSDIF